MIVKLTCRLLAASFALVAGLAATETYNFNPDWRFLKADPTGAAAAGFDDSAWQQVSAPHTYNDIDTFDDWSPLGHVGEINQWGGRTWYRKAFTPPTEWSGKSVILEFEAVRQLCEVYLNGEKLGGCENGFLPFGIDLSRKLRFGEENVIAVMCDNSFLRDDQGGRALWHHYGGGPLFSWNNPHWHPAHGGIYRNVMLHVSDSLHLTRPLFGNLGTVGTYVYTIDPSRETTGIGIEAEVANGGDKARGFTVRGRLLDRSGKEVWRAESPQNQLAPGGKSIIPLKGRLDNPHLWEPKHPYLYQMIVEVVDGGKVLSHQAVPFGVRWFRFTKDRGFFINDRHVKLQGWGMKSVDGWPGLGAANPDWMHHLTLDLVTACGGNFLRWGHTAGGPAQIRSSDMLGIITIQPGVDGEGDLEGHGWDIRAQAWRDTIIYFRNHPSILIWEGGNQSVSKEHVEELKKIAETYDPHGKRAYAHRRANGVVEPYCDITISTEGSGYLEALPTVEGEYNRAESPRRVWDRQTPPWQDWQASGEYNLTAEEYAIGQLFHYEKIASPAHCGGANWIFVDSTSGGRVDSEVTRTSGEMDAMRLPKEAYHACRVLFSDEPDIHIIGHWNYPAGTRKTIRVVADCDEVSLTLNGKELGRLKAATRVVKPKLANAKQTRNEDFSEVEHPLLFTFPAVAWQPGKLEAIGWVAGKPVARHQLETTGVAVKLRLTPVTGPGGAMASGSDVIIVDVEALDAQDRRVPTFYGRVDFAAGGPVTWRGGYNSGRIQSTNHTWLELECGINRVVLRTNRQAGTMTLTASSQGLANGTCSVPVQAFDAKGGWTASLPVMPSPPALVELPVPIADDGPVAPPAGGPAKQARLIKAASYSGPGEKIAFRSARKGEELYTDHAEKLAEFPNRLAGAEMICMPNADWNYSAVDLLQFEARQDLTIYIMHDDRLAGEKMDWLKNDFTASGINIDGGENRKWSLYQRNVNKGDTVLLGSNSQNKGEKRWMMVVFCVPR